LTGSYEDRLMLGKPVAASVIDGLASAIPGFAEKHRPPRLTVIIVGEDPASQVYVGMKVKTARKCGIDSDLIELPASTPEEDILARLDSLNEDEGIDGILVQMPLPGHMDQQKVIERISPSKDVDGLHPFNLGRLAADSPGLVPCTPLGITVMMDHYGVDTAGKHAVIVGRSILVGKPMALLLAMKAKGGNATVTICHSRTSDMASITRTADILVAAVGSPKMITGDMVKEGVAVFDVGINRVEDETAKKGYRIVGDVDFESVAPLASLITPVPRGVGPMTVAMLMKNTYLAARMALGADDYGEPR
jgi:methylenetetrahydrofolate dehydrogenase (NADP+) / methenyltetrahydrofolate cyclohydrolase